MRAKRHLTRAIFASVVGAASPWLAGAQQDSTAQGARRDSTSVQGSIYRRPFIASSSGTSIGGYVEGNTNYFVEDGVTDGWSMELRRFNLFLYSALAPRLRFFTELEFEHGTKEISLETAQLDFQLTPALAFRAGIVLPPIGAFNQNHDSPRWEFIDRPLVSTRIIPATLAEVGFGVTGRLSPHAGMGLTYDLYLTNGLGDGVIDNAEGRTAIAAGKRDDQFAEDNNGSPALSGRLAVQWRGLGELGVSHYSAIYNSFRVDGQVVDARRRVTLSAVDLNTGRGPVSVRGEAAYATINLPTSLEEMLGSRQWGAHVDVVWRALQRPLLGLSRPSLNLAVPFEYVDLNAGRFATTGQARRDDVLAVVPGISFRPSANTVFKANYRRHRTTDVLGNPAVRLAGYQFGFATYF